MNPLSKIMNSYEVRKDKTRKTFYLSESVYNKYCKAVKRHPKAKSVSSTIENFMVEILKKS
jgi:hypothetical protein